MASPRKIYLNGEWRTTADKTAVRNPYDGSDKLGTIGLPVPSTEIRLVGDDGKDVPRGESGELAVRGTPRPFAVALKISRKGAAFRVTGDGKVSLAEYGISAPSQLGVKTDEEVKVHLDFTARPGVPVSTSGRGGR